MIQPPEKKSRNEKGIERKKQKADDKKYRNDLKQERDEIVSRLSEMGHKMVPNGAEQAEFDQLITSLTDLDRQIDRTTEEDINYYSMRPERGPRNSPAKKRFGDWKEGPGGGGKDKTRLVISSPGSHSSPQTCIMTQSCSIPLFFHITKALLANFMLHTIHRNTRYQSIPLLFQRKQLLSMPLTGHTKLLKDTKCFSNQI